MTNKQKYRELCKQEQSIPIFSIDWWLDAACGEGNWDVVLIEKDNTIIASMPYYLTKQYGFRCILMPRLTQNMGIWLRSPANQKHAARLSYEKSIFLDIIDKLPKFDLFEVRFHYSITNWLPFYWRGFHQTTYYTYLIEDLSRIDGIYANFDSAKRKNIKKAAGIVEVKFDLPADEFYQNHSMTLSKQGEKIHYSFELFNRIHTAAYAHDAGRIIYAVDKDGNIHSALFVIWSSESAHDLISTIDPDFRNSGSASLLILEMIKHVSSKTKRFDFEGSMNESIENSFRRFGAVQKPYFNITRTNSLLLKTALFLKDLKR